uniref:Nicotinic acetylcholine receptor alpha subunit n=1 Tax=Globodera pallida TaxID=36090 RepID=A0A183CBU1_GLOPA
MIPCVGISFLTALVFYLPSDGGEKISLCISILISLTVFFLLLVEIIPSTSLVIPLIGKYLLFTMVLVTLSVIVTVITLNVHYRNPSTHKMSPWMRTVFIEVLPYYLLMRRPPQRNKTLSSPPSTASDPLHKESTTSSFMMMPGSTTSAAVLRRRRGERNSLGSMAAHEKQQIMTTNVWLQHSWTDSKLRWNPRDYGGVEVLYVPSEMIWLPDIVLYNNADGKYQVTIMTKAKLTFNGTVEWTPPAIYKSMCQIDVEWFPFDAQTCEMKFGSWTYGGMEVDLKHKDEHLQYEVQELVPGPDGKSETVWVVDEGIDLNDYYPSVEWDILRVPAKRHQKTYPCCTSPFIDLTYEIHLRRKTLFYTVNLMIPCVGISFLTALVFYLPSDGGEKISLCISILISLTVFFLLLVEIIPSTSLVIPLIGKYLLFTMVLVTLSVIVTVITLNVHYRNPSTHKMSPWMRTVFIEVLPYYLLMRRPPQRNKTLSSPPSTASDPLHKESTTSSFMMMPGSTTSAAVLRRRRGERNSLGSMAAGPSRGRNSLRERDFGGLITSPGGIHRIAGGHQRASTATTTRDFDSREQSPLRSAVESVTFIAEHFRREEDDQQVIEDWKYVSVVLDRIFLITFTVVCLLGCVLIIFRAPTIYDRTPALGDPKK